MTVEFKCGDPAGLAGYLYDECDAAERAAIEAHLAVCPGCASELTALGATRTALASWAPPDAKLGFTITSTDEGSDRHRGPLFDSAQRRPVQWWNHPLPAWAQAAAAMLIFAAGLVAGMRANGMAPARVPTAASAPPAVSSSTVSANDLADVERRLRAEMSAIRAVARPGAEQANRGQTSTARQPQASDDAVLQRVRALLAQSEERQQRELAVRLAQVLRDVDTQRRVDLMRIEQTFGQMEGFTRPELANQRQMINYLIQRTGARTPQQ